MRLGMIVRMDKTGLGNQTRELAYMLKPSKILIINSKPFKNNISQFPEWYKDFNVKAITDGFPTAREKKWFLAGIDAFLTCEIPYGYDLIQEANRRGVRSYIQYNYEFLDYLQQKLPLPTKLISPTSWGLDDVKRKLKVDPVLLRPPLDVEQFKKNKKINIKRTGKIKALHIEGTPAAHDRNGTDLLLESLKYIDADFQLIIKTQDKARSVSDSRVIFDNSNPDDNTELYRDFDFMVLPRRYGGLCLPMNEALASGLPVIMPNVSPNSDILPLEWLTMANKGGSFMTRVEIDIYNADIKDLAERISEFIEMPRTLLNIQKNFAYRIAYDNLSSDILKPKYEKVLNNG